MTISRRSVIKGGAGVGVALLTPLGSLAPALAVPTDGVRFLTADELALLRGLVDRFLPGPPEDTEPGAAQAGCHEAIDALLGAFTVDPPLVYAGAPFSDRGGHQTNHFEDFLPLDAYETKAWRLRILGSQGDPALEFNGPVRGFQQVYREGLAALAAAGFNPDAAGPVRDLMINNSDDPATSELIGVAVVHTIEFMYGPPEYGGNRDLSGWATIGFDGDVHPTGYTDEQVENLDPGDQADTFVLPPGVSLENLLGAAALASSEAGLGVVAAADGRWDRVRAITARLAG